MLVAVPRELIIQLLKEELKNQKLTSGLAALGLTAESYHSDLGPVIRLLLGVKDEAPAEEWYTYYDDQLAQKVSLETTLFHQQLDQLAQELYEQLQQRSKA